MGVKIVIDTEKPKPFNPPVKIWNNFSNILHIILNISLWILFNK